MDDAEASSLTLSQEFDKQLKSFDEIEESLLSSSDDILQKKIESCKKKLEVLTVMISSLRLFSSNELLNEISSESLKFLLLPALLGCLTLKKVDVPRNEALQMAYVYFEDFIRRCKDYEITEIEIPQRKSVSEEDVDKKIVSKSKNMMPTTEDLKLMTSEREEKIKRYREKKEISEKLKCLKENPLALKDEETSREFYLTLINYFIYVSIDEINSIIMEQNMLKEMQGIRNSVPDKKEVKKAQFRPFLITKDDVQKKVFGAGYPSLPVMTVDEFYEMGIKDGRFGNRESTMPVPGHQEELTVDEEDKNIEGLRQKDEWKDTHRTGWGNTYNRS